MTSGQLLSIVFGIGVLILCASYLRSYNLPAAKLAKMALIWIGIFVVIFLIVRAAS